MLASIFTLLATGAIAVLAVPTAAPLEYVHYFYSIHSQTPSSFSHFYINYLLILSLGLETLSRSYFVSIRTSTATAVMLTNPAAESVVSCSPFCSNVISEFTSSYILLLTHIYREYPAGRFQ